jgi:hypothetical protein
MIEMYLQKVGKEEKYVEKKKNHFFVILSATDEKAVVRILNTGSNRNRIRSRLGFWDQ